MVEAGGYAQAAERMHKSQSTLTYAVQKIEQLLGHPVFLELQVKVRPKWRRDERLLERLGI